MYKIKQTPEDFIVNEVSKINIQENGQYSYYILKKINYTTVDALQILAKKFNLPLKNFGFAGNKDRIAVTEQKISIFRGNKNFENVNLDNIELKYLGNGKEPISLGDLEGNEFIITVRNLEKSEIDKIKKYQNKRIRVPNLYGPQRFSVHNHLIGKAIIKRDFKHAVELILKNNGNFESQIEKYLETNKNNYVEALRLVPFKTRTLFVHSYQSFLFNKVIQEYIKVKKKNLRNIKIPIIGFGFEISSIKDTKLKQIIKKIIEEERISPRDFVISQMPELTSEGVFRDLFFQLKLKILEIGSDELDHGKKKLRINFFLKKSCYATVVLAYALQ